MSLWSPWLHIHASWSVKHSAQTTPRQRLLATLMDSNGVDRSEHFGVKYTFIKLFFFWLHIRQVNILYHGVELRDTVVFLKLYRLEGVIWYFVGASRCLSYLQSVTPGLRVNIDDTWDNTYQIMAITWKLHAITWYIKGQWTVIVWMYSDKEYIRTCRKWVVLYRGTLPCGSWDWCDLSFI